MLEELHLTEGATMELTDETVQKFIDERLIIYELDVQKPNTAQEMEDALVEFAYAQEDITIDAETARTALRKRLVYKGGATLAKKGARKKTSVNGYVDAEGRFYTLKPAPLFPQGVL